MERGCTWAFEVIVERIFSGIWNLFFQPLYRGFEQSHLVCRWLIWLVIGGGITACLIGWVGQQREAEWAHRLLLGGGIALLVATVGVLLLGLCVRLLG